MEDKNLPYFSIILPVHNRERYISRAIDSCLTQSFKIFELIIIDDGSIDGTKEVIEKYRDIRIRLIRHQHNLGVGPARNSGMKNAMGRWAVFLDSDDELLPDALSSIHARIEKAPEGIARLQFMGRVDSGETSPEPPLVLEQWDYVTYLRWVDLTYGKRQDSLPVVLLDTFKDVRFYEDRTMEGPYHLDFMKKYHALSCPDIVALYHQDAPNQLTKFDVHRSIGSARDQALSQELMLTKHGVALMAHAPKTYRAQLSGLATLYFLCGERSKGMRYSILTLVRAGWSIKTWIAMCLGIIGPKPLAWAKYLISARQQVQKN